MLITIELSSIWLGLLLYTLLELFIPKTKEIKVCLVSFKPLNLCLFSLNILIMVFTFIEETSKSKYKNKFSKTVFF